MDSRKDYNPNIDHREPPPSLVALRNELPKHPKIFAKAIKGRTFEECIGIVAAELLIVLDGNYDVAAVCDMLVWELRRSVTPGMSKHRGLSGAKIVETKDAITLEPTELILPPGVEKPQEPEKTLVAEAIETAATSMQIFGVTTLVPSKSGCYVVGMKDGKQFGVFYNKVLHSFTDSPEEYVWDDVISIREMTPEEQKAYDDDHLEL